MTLSSTLMPKFCLHKGFSAQCKLVVGVVVCRLDVGEGVGRKLLVYEIKFRCHVIV